jgi:hypothetical protein
VNPLGPAGVQSSTGGRPPTEDDLPVVRISPRRVGWFLAVMIVVLAAGHLLAALLHHGWANEVILGEGPISALLDMDTEGNLPSWYSSACWLVASGLAALVWRTRPRGRGSLRSRWMVLSLVLAYISLDEGAEVHEKISGPFSDGIGLDEQQWVYWAWVGPYLALAIAVAVFTVPLLRSLPAGTRGLMLLAGATFVSGAVGMELVGREVVLDGSDNKGPTYQLAVGIEESLELAGVSLLVFALMAHVRDHVGRIGLEFASTARRGAPVRDAEVALR